MIQPEAGKYHKTKSIWGSVTAGVIKMPQGMSYFAASSCIKMSQEAAVKTAPHQKVFPSMGCILDSVWQQFTPALHVFITALPEKIIFTSHLVSHGVIKSWVLKTREEFFQWPEITPPVSRFFHLQETMSINKWLIYWHCFLNKYVMAPEPDVKYLIVCRPIKLHSWLIFQWRDR